MAKWREEQIGDCRLILGDCLEVMPTLDPVDAILTDPPFGVGNFVQVTGSLRGKGDARGKRITWNETGPPKEFFELARSLSKERIIWGANYFNCFEEKGGAIVWDKNQKVPNFSKADIASSTHFKKVEIVKIPWAGYTARKETNHPCERPVSLYEWCIDYFRKNPRTILDPFMGSASVCIACVNKGLKYIGIEQDIKYFDIACKRVEKSYEALIHLEGNFHG